MAVRSKFSTAPSFGTISKNLSCVFSAIAHAKSTIYVACASGSNALPTAVPFSMIFLHSPKMNFSLPSITSFALVYSGFDVSTT